MLNFSACTRSIAMQWGLPELPPLIGCACYYHCLHCFQCLQCLQCFGGVIAISSACSAGHQGLPVLGTVLAVLNSIRGGISGYGSWQPNTQLLPTDPQASALCQLNMNARKKYAKKHSRPRAITSSTHKDTPASIFGRPRWMYSIFRPTLFTTSCIWVVNNPKKAYPSYEDLDTTWADWDAFLNSIQQMGLQYCNAI